MAETHTRVGRDWAAKESKGDRVPVLTRLPRPVCEWLRDEAATRRTSMSQIVADLVSAAAGRPDLVRELDQEVLPEIA